MWTPFSSIYMPRCRLDTDSLLADAPVVITRPETLVPQTYEILTQEDSGAVNVIIRDETGRTVRILRALSAEDAQRLTVDYALIASREPGVAVMIPTQGRQ